MHWFEQLASFYGERDIPLFHGELLTDAELRISRSGEFEGAEQGTLRIIAPMTESSSCRTFGASPHPLSDTLGYLAGERRDIYLRALDRWADSEYSTAELRAVRDYLHGETLLSDLASAGISAGRDMTPRFTVGGIRLWEDKALHDSYISFVRSERRGKALCCVTGRREVIAELHPRRIISRSSSAKLISDGEKERLVYSGRLTDASQVFPVGREVSFKAHAVLSRMLSEGERFGDRVFAAWDGQGNSAALPFSGGELRPVGEVTVMGFAEVTRGRLSVTFFRRLTAEEYSFRAELWRGSVSLSVNSIAALAFGHGKSGGGLSCGGLLAQTAERLLGCILDGGDIPADILRAIELRARRGEPDGEARSALRELTEYRADKTKMRKCLFAARYFLMPPQIRRRCPTKEVQKCLV